MTTERTPEDKAEDKRIAKLLRAFAKRESKTDAPDIRKVAKLVEDGKYKEAFKAYRSLDTYVREGFPDEAMSHIYIRQVKSKTVISVRALAGETVLGEANLVMPGNATYLDLSIAVTEWEKQIKKKIQFQVKEPKKFRSMKGVKKYIAELAKDGVKS